MKIIFLDIDGVLNSIETNVGLNSIGANLRMDTVDPVKVGLLKFVCDQTDAKIVISSTWRFGRTVDWFVEFFAQHGWDQFPIVGITPSSRTDFRSDEVEQWIDETAIDVEQWVIIDDNNNFHSNQPLVQPNGVHGLTLREVMDMISILGLGEHADTARLASLQLHLERRTEDENRI